MMWQLIELSLLAAGAVHAYVTPGRSPARFAEMMLVYFLAGYCGATMFAVGVVAVVNPDWVAVNMAQVPPGNAVMIWAGFFFLGVSLISMLTIWLRGVFLIAPVLTWSIYWAGATYAHLVADEKNGHAITSDVVLDTFFSHGMVAVILLALSGLLWRSSSAPQRAASFNIEPSS